MNEGIPKAEVDAPETTTPKTEGFPKARGPSNDNEPDLAAARAPLNLLTMEKGLPGLWLQYISPQFEFINRIGYTSLAQFPAHPKGVLLQKFIAEGEKFPQVKYYYLYGEVSQEGDEKNLVIEPLTLSKKDISAEMAENLAAYLLKFRKLPPHTTCAKLYKNGRLECAFAPSQYDTFHLKVELKVDILQALERAAPEFYAAQVGPYLASQGPANAEADAPTILPVPKNTEIGRFAEAFARPHKSTSQSPTANGKHRDLMGFFRQ